MQLETPAKKPDDWELSEKTARSCFRSNSSARGRHHSKLLVRLLKRRFFWNCSVDFATASKMPERLRSPHLTKRATGAEKKQHGQRRVSCESDATEMTICSVRRELSATSTAICVDGNRVVRDKSCLLCGATAFADNRKWTSGSTRSTRTSVRQLHPLDSVPPSAGKVKKRRQPFTRHTRNSVQKKRTNFGVFCILQLVSGLAGWYDESRPSNVKWCKEGVE